MMQLTERSVRTEFALTESGPGKWDATIDETWRGWTGPHGGVIAGLLVEVARAAAPDAGAVRAADTRFVGRPGDGPMSFAATVRTVGRSTTVVDVVARQFENPVALGTVTLGLATTSYVPERIDVAALDVPGPEDCEVFALPPEIVPVGAHFEIRPAAGPLPLSGADEAWMCAWISLVPELVTDAATLMVLADALPPAVFPILRAPVAVPTVALSVHTHSDLVAAPAQPVLVRADNISTANGWSVDEVSIRDRDGRLLIQARQTRRVLG